MSNDPGQKYLSNGTNFVSQHHDTYPAIHSSKANLSGKTVLITGASKGVGRAAAVSYAAAGASGIALGARSSLANTVSAVKEAAKEAGRQEPRILELSLDVTDVKSVELAAKQVSEAFGGKLDVLINNAGYLSRFARIGETDPSEWWRDYEVNVKGMYLVTRSFIPQLIHGELKTIVNTSSIGAHHVRTGASAYQTAKLAVLRFSEFINEDYEKERLLSFAIHPGGVKTELAIGMPEHMHERLIDTPELAGDSLVWLTKERRDWLAGRYVSVNWDLEELLEKKDEIVKGDLLKVRLAVNTFG